MAYNTQPLLTDANGKPIPQYYDPVADAFKPIEGEGGANKTQLTGRKEKILTSDNTQTTTILAGANESVNIIPPSGKQWEIRTIRLFNLKPSNGTTGTYDFVIRVGSNASEAVAIISSNYNENMSVLYNVVELGGTNKKLPVDESAFRDAIRSIVVDNANPLQVFFANNTDVDQANQRTIKISYIERDVV